MTGKSIWLQLARWRGRIQAGSTLILNSYVTQRITKGLPCPALNCYACPVASFACPIGSLQHFIGRGKLPLYVLGAIGLVGALIGRASCGWICPFGWFQELLHRIPTPKLRLPNRFNWTRYGVLAVLVLIVPLLTGEPWFCKLCPAGSLEASIPMALISADIRRSVSILYWVKIGILGIFLAWMSVTRRPFCRWICPLGALWSPLNPISSFHLQVDQACCTQCGRCQAVCPVDIRIYEHANAGACIRCLECVRACPEVCISVTSPGWSLEADRTGNLNHV